jgi:hypothetical protein
MELWLWQAVHATWEDESCSVTLAGGRTIVPAATEYCELISVKSTGSTLLEFPWHAMQISRLSGSDLLPTPETGALAIRVLAFPDHDESRVDTSEVLGQFFRINACQSGVSDHACGSWQSRHGSLSPISKVSLEELVGSFHLK